MGRLGPGLARSERKGKEEKAKKAKEEGERIIAGENSHSLENSQSELKS
jgi:hypothetical protein